MGPSTGLDMYGKFRPHRDLIPDRPAPSSVARPTELPGPQLYCIAQVQISNSGVLPICRVRIQSHLAPCKRTVTALFVVERRNSKLSPSGVTRSNGNTVPETLASACSL